MFFQDCVNWAANLFCPVLKVSVAISLINDLYPFVASQHIFGSSLLNPSFHVIIPPMRTIKTHILCLEK
jgi:hypothetical protein